MASRRPPSPELNVGNEGCVVSAAHSTWTSHLQASQHGNGESKGARNYLSFPIFSLGYGPHTRVVSPKECACMIISLHGCVASAGHSTWTSHLQASQNWNLRSRGLEIISHSRFFLPGMDPARGSSPPRNAHA